MGLEGVELVMNVEEAFGIRISDQDASEVRTVGQCCDLIERILSRGGQEPCSTGATFYRLRRALTGLGAG